MKATAKNIAISGQLLTYNRGMEKFSCLRSACDKFEVTFFHPNFHFFWGCSAFFKQDGLHPNHRGSQMLVQNVAQYDYLHKPL